MEAQREKVRKYINRRFGYSLEIPDRWARGLRESPGGDTAVLLNENGNLIRLLVSHNAQTKDYLSGMAEDPFRTRLVTDAGASGELVIGLSKNAPGRVAGLFCAELKGTLYHLVADLSMPFAVENKDALMDLARSLTLPKGKGTAGAAGKS